MPVEESLARTVKLKLPPAVGVPLKVPLDDSVKPAGKAPLLIVKLVYGAVPPTPLSAWLKAAPTWAAGSVPGLKLMLGAATVIEYAWLPVYGPLPIEESFADTVKLKMPPAVGVPLMVPVFDKVKPAGNAPALMVKLLYGAVPPEPVNACA